VVTQGWIGSPRSRPRTTTQVDIGQGAMTSDPNRPLRVATMSKSDLTGTTTGTYDARDGLLTYGNLTFTYTRTGKRGPRPTRRRDMRRATCMMPSAIFAAFNFPMVELSTML
jgi:hypothetical protein